MKINIKDNIKLMNIIYSLMTYLSLKLYNNFSFFGFFSLILYFFILGFYNYNIRYEKKQKKTSLILAIIFSLFLSVGNIVSKNLNLYNIGFLNFKNIIYIVIMFLGFLPFLLKVMYILINKLKKINILNRKEKLSKKQLLIIFLIIFISWFPFFLRYFPAAMTPDSYYVVHNANEKILSDHHTFGFTWFFALFFYIGKQFFTSLNSSIAIYTLFQMLFMDLIFVYGLNYLSKKGVKKIIIYILTAFIAINPLFSHYSVTLWRDVLFGMLFIPIILQLHKYVDSNYNYNWKDVLIFTLSIILMLFFRNNGIYIFMFMTPFLILIGKKDIIKKIAYCLAIIVLYFVIKGPIFDNFNVSPGIKSEAYSIPIQQISRVVASEAKLDKETTEFLENLYDISIVKTDYIPTISDNMKRTIKTDFLEKNKVKFYKTYLDLLMHYPNLYFEAYFTQTLGYWYPDINQWSTAGQGESFLEEEVKTTPLLNSQSKKLVDKTLTRKLPFTMIFWSIGLNFYILIFLTAYLIYSKNMKYILYFIPIYGVWFTLMIASPVFCEVRYIFSLFTTIPFYIILSMIKTKKISNK